jgi:hypothetical protein
LRWENPPEGAKNLQGYSIHTETHIPQQGFTRFLRIWSFAQKREMGASAHQNRGRGELRRDGLLTEEGRRGTRGRRSPVGDGGRRWREIAGGGAGVARETERTAGGGVSEPLARSRAGGLFLKRDMGAPDSLQCLSGAHRTAHSSCPVNHRTAHRKTDLLRAAAGAPDIAQCSVRCTPDCPVSPDRGEFGQF